jgi:hypothetical protein
MNKEMALAERIGKIKHKEGLKLKNWKRIWKQNS